MEKVYLLLGSNEGDRQLWFTKAITLINENCGKVMKQSQIYETAAWGREDQPAFLNMVLEISTNLPPELLLDKTLAVENALGRQRTIQWGQRTLDIDILFYNDAVINTPALTIPHRQIAERRFTLAPLAEIAGGFIHPVLKKTVDELFELCPDELPVNLYNRH